MIQETPSQPPYYCKNPWKTQQAGYQQDAVVFFGSHVLASHKNHLANWRLEIFRRWLNLDTGMLCMSGCLRVIRGLWEAVFFYSEKLTWPMAKRLKLFGITYLVGKKEFKLFFQGPLAE